MRAFILDIDHKIKGGKSRIEIYCKSGERTERVSLKYEPYFYVLPDQKRIEKALEKVEKLLKGKVSVKSIEKEQKTFLGKTSIFLKITCDSMGDVTKARDIVKQLEAKRGGSGEVLEEYEYSMNPYRKFLIDNNLSGWVEVEAKNGELISIKPIESGEHPRLKLLAFDLECLERNGEQVIVMISLFSDDFKRVLTTLDVKGEFVEQVSSEERLLRRFVELVNEVDPDVIATFNGDGFDFRVLLERAEKLKLKVSLGRNGEVPKLSRRARESSAKVSGRFHFDVFRFINNILSPHLQTEVLTLDAVSAELLGDRKIEMDYQEMLESIRKRRDLNKLAVYCLKDSELTYRLAELLLPQVLEIASVVGQSLFDVSRMTYGQLVEWYLMRKAREFGEVLPNQPKHEEIVRRRSETYVGGFVKEPIAGLHENIAVVDFKSLYPTIIASFNISPETVNCSCCKENGTKVPEIGHWICKRKKGFVASVIGELIERREEIKQKLKKIGRNTLEYKLLDTRQYALKIIANACYGMFGFAGARYYCKPCAESIAALGRHFIRLVISRAEASGFTVVYGDTDSCFLKSREGEKMEKFKERVMAFLNEINGELPGVMKLELQDFYVRGIFIPRGVGYGTAKKRYALLSESGELLIRGLETVRRDWCNLAKEVQRNVLVYVLKEKDVEKAIEYVRKVIADLKSKHVKLKDLVIYEQLTKPLGEYKQISPHVVAAKKLLDRGEIVGEGSIVMFVITKGKGSISDRAEPAEYVTLEEVDEEYYVEHQIIPAAMRVLAALGISESRLKERGLERFLR